LRIVFAYRNEDGGWVVAAGSCVPQIEGNLIFNFTEVEIEEVEPDVPVEYGKGGKSISIRLLNRRFRLNYIVSEVEHIDVVSQSDGGPNVSEIADTLMRINEIG